MNTPDEKTRDKCDAFARAVMELAKSESTRLELKPADVRGVLFGVGIGAALDGGATVDDICKLVQNIARAKRDADAAAKKKR